MDTEKRTDELPDPEEERLWERFQKLISDEMSDEEIEEKLAQLQNDPDVAELRNIFCNLLLDAYCLGLVKYSKKEPEGDEARHREVFSRNVSLLPQTQDYALLHSVAFFYRHDHTRCMQYLKQFLESIRNVYTEAKWAYDLLTPFKNAYPGFWLKVGEILREYPCEPYLPDLCVLTDAYYRCGSAEEQIELLLPFVGAHPGFSVPKELLALAYYDAKLWDNAIACFQMVEDGPLFLSNTDIQFWLALSHGKTRDTKEEEACYRKCLEAAPEYPFAKNNLGYCLYRQKRYAEARGIFEECLRDKRDLPYAANNYVRTLLALGQYKTAREFVREGSFKVAADLVKRVKAGPAVNTASAAETAPLPGDGEDAPYARRSGAESRGEQFSSEKILEDELCSRIKAGREVFGKKLRIYSNPKKDFNGRQYPVNEGKGRIDLLCVDETGNYYVIELKKDSGYDDPYVQIKNYMEWVQRRLCAKNKKTYGIICLNSPSASLVETVRRDDSVSLYEYRISFSSVT